MEYLLLSLVIQINLLVHAVRAGRPSYWVFILLAAPGIGALAYSLIECAAAMATGGRGWSQTS